MGDIIVFQVIKIDLHRTVVLTVNGKPLVAESGRFMLLDPPVRRCIEAIDELIRAEKGETSEDSDE